MAVIVVFFMFMFQNYSGALIINYYSPSKPAFTCLDC